MLNFNQLRVFYHVAKHQSVTLAARELYIAQPTATNHLKAFEDQLDIKLFEKKGTRLVLTVAGEKLFHNAKKIFDEEKEFENIANQIRKSNQSILRLGTSSTDIQGLATFLKDHFNKSYPNVVVTLSQGSSLSTMHSILNYDNEIAIVSKVEDHPEVCFDFLKRSSLVFISNPAHPFAKKKSVSIEDALKEPIIIHQQGSGTQKILMGMFKENKIAPNIRFEATNSEIIKKMVQKGEGISLLSEGAVISDIAEGKLARVSVNDPNLYINVFIIYLKNHTLSDPAKEFIRILKKMQCPPCNSERKGN